MSRKPRIDYEGAYHHVMNRGQNQQTVFHDTKDFEAFLKILEEGCEQFSQRILAYCLMGNHYHLLVCSLNGEISRFMRHLNGVYTQKVNRRHKTDGPLFKGRFRSILVQDDRYYYRVIRYIHMNPVEAYLSDAPEQYRWSSDRYYRRGDESRPWLLIGEVLNKFSSDKRKAIKHYEAFMRCGVDSQTKDFYGSFELPDYFGDAAFEDMLSLEELIKVEREVDARGAVLEVVERVSKVFDVSSEALAEGKTVKTLEASQVVMYLLREVVRLRYDEVSEVMPAWSMERQRKVYQRLSAMMRDKKGLWTKIAKARKMISRFHGLTP